MRAGRRLGRRRRGTTQEQGERTDAVAQVKFSPSDSWSAYGFVQDTVAASGGRHDNNRFGLGGSYRLARAAAIAQAEPPVIETFSAAAAATLGSVSTNGHASAHSGDGTGLPSLVCDGALTLDEIERIEVVRGPASVLYGSEAVSGVIQLFTREQKSFREFDELNGVLGTRDYLALGRRYDR